MPNLTSKIALAVALALPVAAHAAELTPQQQAFRAIYQELVEIDTTDSVGDTLRAAEAMAARLKAGGIPAADVQVISTAPRRGNLVARLRGTGARKPILLMAHMDVVEAKREDWDFDPFKLQEVDGQFRGRGVIDDKAMAASFVANLIEYAKEHFKPDRDIILALTTDEELSDSPHDGAHVLLEQHRDLVDAELALNEGGGGALRNGKPFRLSIQLAEKVYQSYRLEVKDPGGHSASGRRDSAIYRLADGLTRLARYDFPARLNPITRAYFERMATSEETAVADAIQKLLGGNLDSAFLKSFMGENPEATLLKPLTERPSYNAQIRTTCVATLLEAGHAENALPQTARATVNCRILPDEPVNDVEKTLIRVVGDPKIAITPIGKPVSSPPSPPNPEVMQAVARIAGEMWPGVPIIPTMSAGYTDSRWLRNAGIPAYGVSGLFSDGNNGVHGQNERVGVKEIYDSKEFLYRLVKQLAAPGQFGQK
jgi:acetylornithine deacetylase/succinyl-diaminopimelate desuccinylase-like protein